MTRVIITIFAEIILLIGAAVIDAFWLKANAIWLLPLCVAGIVLTALWDRWLKKRQAALAGGVADNGKLTHDELSKLTAPLREAPKPDEFSEAFRERSTDRIPFVRLRDIAPEFGIDLSSSETPSANLAYDIEGALRQAAVDGNLQVWGRKYQGPVQSNDPLLKIPASHFAEFEFGHGNLHYKTENRFSHTGKITKRLEELAGQAYYDLQLSDSDARAVLRQYAKDNLQ
jgi:hypothetical protein